MDPSLFSEKVDIREVSFLGRFGKKIGPTIELTISKIVGENVFLYEVHRLEEGLVHPAYVIEFPFDVLANDRSSSARDEPRLGKFYAVIRFYEANEGAAKYFDRAEYYSERIQHLQRLGPHYPKFRVFASEGRSGKIVLQEFFFYPICKFDDAWAVREFFQLMYAASKAELFLDYNQNHWLWSKEKRHLIYTDSDYIDRFPFKKSVAANFSQATLFLSEGNAAWYAETLNIFLASPRRQERNFGEVILEQIEEKLAALGTRERSEAVKSRQRAYEAILSGIRTRN